MVIAKSEREFELMRKAGRVVAKVFETLEPMCVSGVNTYELNQKAEEVIFSNGCLAPCKGYYDYPAAICISVNDTLIHGIPNKNIILHDGDIVSLDVVASYNGYCADATRTYVVGGICKESTRRLLETTRDAFYKGLEQVKIGNHIGDISNAIQEYVESHGYSVSKDFTGHGIGKNMHEDPSIPNFGKPGTGAKIVKGMGLAIEPMVLEGKSQVRILSDGWTVKSKDGKLTCHYENTVITTDDGYEIITLTEKELKQQNV